MRTPYLGAGNEKVAILVQKIKKRDPWAKNKKTKQNTYLFAYYEQKPINEVGESCDKTLQLY